MSDVRHDESVVYCDISDLQRRFRNEGAFEPGGNPSEKEALESIREASAEIDDYTRMAWRPNLVVEEFSNFDGSYRWHAGRPVILNKMYVRDFDEWDSLEIWEGNGWEDWLADPARSSGRENDYWLEKKDGILWLYKRFLWRAGPQLRLAYRYGQDVDTTTKTLDTGEEYDVIDQPRSIKKACSYIAAMDFLSTDQHSQLVPGGEGGISPEEALRTWDAKVYGDERKTGLLDRHVVDPAWVEPL